MKSASRTPADKLADLSEDNAGEKYQDELHVRWESFLQRVRIHEMLKCLRGERRKLQVLREHTDLDEIMQKRFAQLGVKRRKFEADEEVSSKRMDEIREEDAEKEEEAEDEDEEEINKSGKKRKTKFSSDDESDTQELNAIFLRTQKEEEEGLAEVYPNLKRVLADPKYVAKSAVKMFRTRTHITDEEFEEILELCNDRVEQQALKDAFEERKNREKYLHKADEKRQMLYDFVNSNFFVRFLLITIIVSIIGIFLLTFEEIGNNYLFPLQIMDACIIGVFVVEALFKIMIYKWAYFRGMWNLLDLLIIFVNLLEVTVELVTRTMAITTEIKTNMEFKFLKSLRALRLLRIIKFLPNLQTIVATVFHSMLSMGSIAVLMSLFIFVFAVLGRGLFFEEAPEQFGNIGYAFVTLFQLLTLDDWFELLSLIDRDAEENENNQYWIMFGYLFCYIVIEYFVFLNLFVAVLVDNFQLTLADAELRKQKEALIYIEGNEMYDEMNKLNKDGEIEEENTEDDLLKYSEYVNMDNLELEVEDYFPTVKGTRENALLEHIFKDLASIDFERYLWTRRLSILNMIMDKAQTQGINQRWKLQDSERLSARNKETVDLTQLSVY